MLCSFYCTSVVVFPAKLEIVLQKEKKNSQKMWHFSHAVLRKNAKMISILRKNCRIFGFCFLSIIYFEQKCKILRKSLQNTKKMFAKFAIFALFFVRWKPYLNFYNILCSELSEQGWMGAGCKGI